MEYGHTLIGTTWRGGKTKTKVQQVTYGGRRSKGKLVLEPQPIGSLDPKQDTIAEYLKPLGYAPAHVGKWHLGSSQMAQLPSRRGFHESFAYLDGSMHSHLTHMITPATACGAPGVDLWENETPVYAHGGIHSCELFATRAVDMIARHDLAKPLFMYVALAEGHGPYDEVPRHSAAATSCSEDTEECVTLRHYRGMIACADEATSNIIRPYGHDLL